MRKLVCSLLLISSAAHAAVDLRFTGFNSPIAKVEPWRSRGGPFVAALISAPGYLWNEYGKPIVAFDAENANFHLSSGHEAGLWKDGAAVAGGVEYLLNLDGSGFVWSLRVFADRIELLKDGQPALERVELLEPMGPRQTAVVVKHDSSAQCEFDFGAPGSGL